MTEELQPDKSMKWNIIVATWQNWEDKMSTDQLASDEP